MRAHHGMAKLDNSNLNRHLHDLTQVLIRIFMALGQSLKQLNTESRYLIDSFPVTFCKNKRIKRNKLLHGEAYGAIMLLNENISMVLKYR